MIGLPGVESLWAEPAAVDHVRGQPAHSNNTALLHANVDTATVGAQHAGRPHPPIWRFADLLIYAIGPEALACKGRALAPKILTAIATFKHRTKTPVSSNQFRPLQVRIAAACPEHDFGEQGAISRPKGLGAP